SAVSIPPNDIPAPRLPTARGALRRSLLIWGWGQLATGDWRGWLLLPLEPLCVAALAVLGVWFAPGEAVGWVFLAGFVVLGAWGREEPRLRNALVVAVAAAGSNSGLDPARPFDAVRWEADQPSADRNVVVHARIVRRYTARDSFLGLVPTTIQRLVPIADLGT